MDINSYSYMNTEGETQNIKQAETADNDIIYFDYDVNFFQDKAFTVSALYNDKLDRVFEFTDIAITGYKTDTREQAYNKAVEYFNSLVSEKDMIIID